MRVSKNWRFWLLGLVVLLGGTAAFVWLRPYYLLATSPVPEDRCPGHEKFEANTWRDSVATYSDLAPRGCMVNDLLRRTKLVGMDRSHVIDLLGEPNHAGYFEDYQLVYWLGPEPGLFSIDSEWLVIKLDRAGRVAEAKVMTD